jgi:uncharacterized damage-inducible protein DinB
MTITPQIAKQLREVHFGGNWTASCLKEHLADVTWQQATTKMEDYNTIVTLVYHMHYYVSVVLKVLQGEPLNAKDAYSFNHPLIENQQDWEQLLQQVWNEVEALATQIEQLPDSILTETFADPKYGNYYRNLTGVIENMHYHLGQIVIIKKML